VLIRLGSHQLAVYPEVDQHKVDVTVPGQYVVTKMKNVVTHLTATIVLQKNTKIVGWDRLPVGLMVTLYIYTVVIAMAI
jgi:hypothetical protein